MPAPDYTESESYARLVEQVVMDAFLVCKRGDKAGIIKVLEFARREKNPVLGAYCEAFEKDYEQVREVLERRAEEALEVL